MEMSSMDNRLGVNRRLDKYRYRKDARVVSIVDIIVSLLILLFLLLAILFLVRKDMSLPEGAIGTWNNRKLEDFALETLVLMGRFLLNSFQLGVAICLYFGTTKKGSQSLGAARLWIGTSVFLIVMLIIQLILIGFSVIIAVNPVAIVTNILEMFFRIFGIVFVRQHLREITRKTMKEICLQYN